MEQREKAVFKAAVVMNDEHGLPNYMTMYYMEPGTYEPEDVPEMFKVNGKTMAAVLISQFANTLINDVPCSLPFSRPASAIDWDKANKLCRGKGKGWHLLTNTEYTFLTDEADKLGHKIRGNTDRGSSYDNPQEKGVLYDGYHTLTGLDPVAWSHDGTKDGVFGLCGNFWEWVAGLSLTKGGIRYIPDNDAAAEETDMKPNGAAWKNAEVDGKALKLSGGYGVKLTTGEVEDDWNGCHFSELELEELEEVPEVLHKLGVIPRNWKEEKAGIWADSSLEEAVPVRGSGFAGASDGGVSALGLSNPRSGVDLSVSFRSALCVEDWQLVTEILSGAR